MRYNGRVNQALTKSGRGFYDLVFFLTIEKVGGGLPHHTNDVLVYIRFSVLHGGARGFLSRSLTPLIPAYGVGVVHFSVQLNRYTFVQC